LTIGYHVTATVLGDTFTRANVLVQLWHGGVGGTGRLIGTVLVPRMTGSTNETKSSEVSVFWETRNPTLFGKQELHAVILHSGFSTEAANVISHVSRTVSVACYGRVDACGVCGGNNGTCGGCDGVALSGKTVDACGVCGGTGSTCCIPKPAQAEWHYVRVDNHDDDRSSMVTRTRVGDLVVWENLLDRKVEVVGGAYHYSDAPAVDLARLKAQSDHRDLATDLDLEAFLKVPFLRPLPPCALLFMLISFLCITRTRTRTRTCTRTRTRPSRKIGANNCDDEYQRPRGSDQRSLGRPARTCARLYCAVPAPSGHRQP
jgi:hypothetical protein